LDPERRRPDRPSPFFVEWHDAFAIAAAAPWQRVDAQLETVVERLIEQLDADLS
jgi:hypothetical protein